MEYIRYTERRPITRPFKPTDKEHALYEAVSSFLQRDDSYALPQRQSHLTTLILRKLLASSSQAIADTSTMRTLWDMEKNEMQKRHVLFQEDRDSYVGMMLNA